MVQRFIKFYRHYAQKWPTSHQFVKYNIVGFFNTIIDFGLYILLTRSFLFWQYHFLLANAFAFLVTNIFSFFGNKKFTFKNSSPYLKSQYIKFLIVSIIYLVIVQSILYTGVNLLNFGDIWVKIVASVIGMFWNFYAHKYWSFREKNVII